MKLTNRTLLSVPCFLLVAACGNSDAVQQSAADDSGDDYDSEELAEFREAIPSEGRLTAVTPGEQPDPNALTVAGTSELAKLAIGSAIAVNAPAKAVVLTLRALTSIKPTLYDSEKRQFVWGPFDNDDGYGKVLAYIQKNPDDSDFEYGYALVRLEGEDLSTGVPVIWGGATPLDEADDEGDRSGAGVTLWDFEANRKFAEKYDPDFDEAAAVDRGRFVMLFGRNDEDGARFKFNVAVFRDFVAKDAERPDPANADYFYGHYKGQDGMVVDFVDWSLQADLCDEGTDACFEDKSDTDNASETLDFRAAFLNRGTGRAEAQVSGGDLTQAVDVAECWDEDIDRTHIELTVDGEPIATEGECEAPFAETIAELGVPTLDDVDPALLARMSCVAESGTACEEK